MDALGAATRNPYLLAERLLGIVTAALDNNEPYSQPAPQRRYVSHGTPVLDLPDQLTVHLNNARFSTGLQGDFGSATAPKIVLIDLTVTLVNSYPTGIIQQAGGKIKAIPTEVFRDASDQSYANGWTAYTSVILEWGANCQSCSDFTLSPLQPIDPEGGTAGWQFVLTTEIPRLRQEV